MPYIMAVDLGGTNCRFAGFTLDKGILSLHRMGKRKTAELPDTGALISACGTALDRHPRTADAFVVGMAGPVADPLKARLTNAPLEVDLTDAGERYGIRSCRSLRVPDRSRFKRPLRARRSRPPSRRAHRHYRRRHGAGHGLAHPGQPRLMAPPSSRGRACHISFHRQRGGGVSGFRGAGTRARLLERR